MSHFYGLLQGHRGVTTRCGTKNSGITATLRSWVNVAECSLVQDIDGSDLLVVKKPRGLKMKVLERE